MRSFMNINDQDNYYDKDSETSDKDKVTVIPNPITSDDHIQETCNNGSVNEEVTNTGNVSQYTRRNCK